MSRSYKVSDSLFLVQQEVSSLVETKDPTQTNFVVCIDCSGSMSSDLPRIREQLKLKLPQLLADKDTLSLISFSGRGQFSTILEGEPVASLKDLKNVYEAIDRGLRVQGLTGFKEPLLEVAALVGRVGKKLPGSAFSLFFMSDGCDNSWPRNEVLEAVEKAANGLAAATFVEYGYYADRPLLTQMAERSGGSLIFSQTFDTYQTVFTNAMNKRPQSIKKVEVTLPNADVIGGFVYAMQGTDLLTFSVDGNKTLVPEGVSEVYFLSPAVVGNVADRAIIDITNPAAKTIVKTASDKDRVASWSNAVSATYAAISLFTTRMKSDIVLPLLRATGDVTFIEKFSTCFGKQKYSEFMNETKAAAFDSNARLTQDWNPNRVPRDDAFTALDMLKLLASDQDNKLLLDHPSFSYNAISRGRVDANTVLTDDEQAEIESLTQQMTGTKDPKVVASLSAKIASITNKPEALTFTTDPNEGYSISNLVYNEERPNVSVQVRKTGTVDISKRLPSEHKGKIPEKFSTFIYRNYAIIKDGLINVDTLPVKLTATTEKTIVNLWEEGKIPDGVLSGKSKKLDHVDGALLINLAKLPVINRQMIKSVSAKTFFEMDYELTKARAAQKVYNSIKKERGSTKKSDSFETTYGADGAAWLKEQGFTDYSGFNPKAVSVESTDFYMGKELKSSLSGLSSLPTLEKVREAIKKGKLTPSAALMAPVVKEVDEQLTKNAATVDTWLEAQAGAAQDKCRKLLFDLSQIRFGVIVGQVWFNEFPSLDINSMVIKMDGNDVDCKVEMREIQIKI